MATTQNNRNYIILGGLGLATVIAFLLINYFADSRSARSFQPTIADLNTEILQLESALLEMEVIQIEVESDAQTLEKLLDEKYDQIVIMEQQIAELERQGKVDQATIRELRNKVNRVRGEVVNRYKEQINELVKDNFNLVQTIDSASLSDYYRDSAYQAKYDSLVAMLEDCGQENSRADAPKKEIDSVPILEALNFSFEYKAGENKKRNKLGGSVKQGALHTIYFQFKLRGNELVKDEAKLLYVALVDPNGKTYNQPPYGGTATIAGREIVYTRAADVQYKSGKPNEVNAEFTFPKTQEIPKGRHFVRVFYDGQEIGQSPKFLVR